MKVKPALKSSNSQILKSSYPRAFGLAAIFVVKAAVLLQLAGHPLLQPGGGLDSDYYLQLARRVAGGDLLLGPGLYFVSPLYIYFLAAALAAGGGSLLFVKVVQIALGTAACGLVWLAAREWFGTRAAWMALALVALTGVFTFYEVLILQAAIDPFLTALDLWLLTRALRTPGARWPLLAGIALAIHTLNRPNMFLVGSGLVVILFARRATRRAVAPAFLAGLLIGFAPVAIRNAVAAGTFMPVPSHGGLNFYIGNNPRADGTYARVEGITPNIAGQAADARRVAERAEGRPLTDAEVSAHFTRRALAWMRENPGAAARLFLRKAALTLNATFLTLNYSYPFYRDQSAVLRALVIGPLVLVPLGLAGLFAHRLRGEPGPSGFAVWAAVVPLLVLSIAIFFVAARYRLPLLVPLCITAGGLVDAIWTMARTRGDERGPKGRIGWRGLAPIAPAVLAVLVIGSLAAWDFGLDEGLREEQTGMAVAMIDRGRIDEADPWIARAQPGHPDPAAFHLRIGRAFLDARRADKALPHLEAAHRAGARADAAAFDLASAYAAVGRPADAARVLASIRPDAPRDAASHVALGRLAQQLQQPALAASFFRAATRTDPANAEAFEQLGLTLATLGRVEEAIGSLEVAVRLAPASARAHLNLAVAYAQAGRMEEAREGARRALAVDPTYQRARDFLRALDR